MAEPPRTPPKKFITPTTTPPPAPRDRTPVARISCNINTRDALGPFYWENFDKPPDFEVPELKGGDFRERPTVEEWADRVGLRLASGESVLAGRPDTSELKPGAKLPPSIEQIDRLLKKGDEDPMSLSGRSHSSEPKSKPEVLPKTVEGQKEMADLKDSKPPSQKSKKPNPGQGLMLPPPVPAPKAQQKKADKQTPKPSSQKPDESKEKVGPMPQRPLKGAAFLQEMADDANPLQAEEERAKVFMDRLPYVQAASRRLQGQLEIHADETWPLPPLPDDRNPFILETNAIKIRTALENCKEFAVPTDRESGKFEFLDVAAKSLEMRVVYPAGQTQKSRLKSFEEEKKAREAEASNAIARMMDEGLQEEKKELEEEGMSGEAGKTSTSNFADHFSEVSSTPKSLFHSVGPTPTNTAPQTSQGSTADLPTASEGSSSIDTAEQERRDESAELRGDPRFLGIGPDGPEYDGSATTDPADGSDATGGTPEWVYRENATPDPHYDSEGNSVPYNTPTASNDDQEMRTPTQETETASAASENILDTFAPPSQELRALSVHDSEIGGTQSMMDEAMAALNPQDKGKGEEASSNPGGNAPYASQDQQEGKGKPAIPNFFGDATMGDSIERYGKTRGLDPKELDVAASLRNHRVTLVGETEPKTKERNPPVPQPENMPNTLTEAICSYIPLEAKSILTLTLERVDSPVPSPTDQRCILLKHFEVGLDGVEGLCQGTARIPETPEVTAERERRLGKLGTFKQGDGGFYKALKRTQQKEQQYGKGYWYFFGVKFKQTGKERKLRKGGKWLLFGAPIEAVYHLDIKRNQENVTVMVGGGVDRSGTAFDPFKAYFKRTRTIFSRGGLAPIDIWPGGEDWDDGVFEDIKAALANNGLRVGFLYADTEIFLPKRRGFPAAGKDQDEKKRKQSGPEMTEEEMKAMEKSMKPKKLSAEVIGHILATKVISDRAKQDAAARLV